jgi:hypothetical protein
MVFRQTHYISPSVFHAALIIGAALQVYETKIALMTLDDCDGTFDFVVCLKQLLRICSDVVPNQNCGGPGTLWQKVKPFLIVAPCVISISWVLMLFFIRKLYDEFGLDKSFASFDPRKLI